MSTNYEVCGCVWRGNVLERRCDQHEADPLICPLCSEPIEVGDEVDKADYGTCHHHCPDSL